MAVEVDLGGLGLGFTGRLIDEDIGGALTGCAAALPPISVSTVMASHTCDWYI